MNTIKIEIIKLGKSQHEATIKRLDRFKRNSASKLFEITEVKEISLPDSDRNSWVYSDELLLSVISKSETKADFRLGIIDAQIEGNFFARELSTTIGVISFYQADEFFERANLDLLNYLLLVIYQAVVLFSCHKSIREGEKGMHHDEARGCIFDMCGSKKDIVVAASNPSLCSACETEIRKCALSDNFIPLLKKELKKIKKPMFYRIVDWIKKHLILSLFITVVSTIAINVISSFIFEKLKAWFGG